MARMTVPWTSVRRSVLTTPFLVRLLLVVHVSTIIMGVGSSMGVTPPSSAAGSSSSVSVSRPKPAVQVRVCTGADCRVDGASECLRMMQKLATTSKNDNKTQQVLQVQAAPCLGPCGDGPNVIVVDKTTRKRIVDTALQDEIQSRKSGGGRRSLVPAQLFGANVAGVYQVRTFQDAARVMDLAVTINDDNDTDEPKTTTVSPKIPKPMNPDNSVINSTRAWYDRPRNERLMLQRLMHISILAGLANSSSSSELSNPQWVTAATLWIASNFIMKESLLELLLKKKQRIKLGRKQKRRR